VNTAEITFYRTVKKKLDEIGPGMCLAKWTQATLHLSTGYVHMCHHPVSRKIPLIEIEQNPKALFNNLHLKEQRKQMLAGVRPNECDFCWRIEDSDSQQEVWSDRVFKSGSQWARSRIDNIKSAGYSNDINPNYLEISFSNACNFKCAYCSPNISSQWMEEIERYGSYPTSDNFNNLGWFIKNDQIPIPNNQNNPYVDSFWKYWPELYPTLHTFRITGGEPLMAKDTFRVLDYIINNPRQELELAVNSNLCVTDQLFNQFIEKAQKVSECVKSLTIFTSAEAKGKCAEYVRHGMNYNLWLDNCHRLLEKVPNAKLTIMSTYNALSVTSYKEFLNDMIGLDMLLDIPYLRYPHFLSVGILDDSFIDIMKQSSNFMRENDHFTDSSRHKLERINQMFESELEQDHIQQRKDFILFIKEYDRRRGTDFLSVFPEMEKFYRDCERLVLP